ncbi:hypothetical protein DL96DRAFT_1581962 [Flagelloscypha sp. PMI_526]|nr:hypothetical protein DL96DRAFT_1581962 [Flagelloscypha sp. PMI_526]
MLLLHRRSQDSIVRRTTYQTIIPVIDELAQIWKPWKGIRLQEEGRTDWQRRQLAKMFLSLPSSEIKALSCVDDSSTMSLSSEHLEYVNARIKTSHERLLNSLVLTRMHCGRMKTAELGFSLRHSLWSLVKRFSNLFLKPTFTFTYSIEPSIPDYLIGDSEKLTDILQRLLAHSSAYRTPSMHVTLKVVPDVNLFNFAHLDLPVAAGLAKLMGSSVRHEPLGNGMVELSVSLGMSVKGLNLVPDHWKGRRVLIVSQSDYELPIGSFDIQVIRNLEEVHDKDFYFDMVVLENMDQILYFLSREDNRVTTPIVLLTPGPVKGALLSENRVSSHISDLSQLSSIMCHLPLSNPTPFVWGNSRRILVVDDNLINQKLVSSIVERHYGRRLLIANNGEEAISHLTMDSHMPYLNGLETTRLIRQYERENCLPKIPIVGMGRLPPSGMSSFVHPCLLYCCPRVILATHEFYESWREAGINEMMTSPHRSRDIVGKVEKYALHKRKLDETPTGRTNAHFV